MRKVPFCPACIMLRSPMKLPPSSNARLTEASVHGKAAFASPMMLPTGNIKTQVTFSVEFTSPPCHACLSMPKYRPGPAHANQAPYCSHAAYVQAISSTSPSALYGGSPQPHQILSRQHVHERGKLPSTPTTSLRSHPTAYLHEADADTPDTVMLRSPTLSPSAFFPPTFSQQ